MSLGRGGSAEAQAERVAEAKVQAYEPGCRGCGLVGDGEILGKTTRLNPDPQRALVRAPSNRCGERLPTAWPYRRVFISTGASTGASVAATIGAPIKIEALAGARTPRWGH